MIEIGKQPGECTADDEQIRSIARGIERNKIIKFDSGHESLIISNANEIKRLGIAVFARWRVIGMGLYWVAASTANDDPIIEFGHNTNLNGFGTMAAAITGGEKFCAYDHQKYDPLNLSSQEIITETSATLVVTWTEGVDFNVWQTTIKTLHVIEAAVAGMTSGTIRPYMIIEVDTGGKW